MTITATLRTYRDRIRQISPPWLQNGLAEKILYALGLHVDGFGDALVAGVKLRFPGFYSDESLPYIGRERRIRRGRTESNANYAVRLTRWLVDHQRRGGPYALLAQLHAHYAPNNFPIELVYQSGRRYSMNIDGQVTRDDIVWFPDAQTTKWARWWLFYLTDQFGTPTAAEVEDLKLIPREWNAAHCFGYVVLFPSGGELIDYPPGHLIDEPGTINTTVVTMTIAVDD